jgi:hypothetical protein
MTLHPDDTDRVTEASAVAPPDDHAGERLPWSAPTLSQRDITDVTQAGALNPTDAGGSPVS